MASATKVSKKVSKQQHRATRKNQMKALKNARRKHERERLLLKKQNAV